jgi:dihydroorotate dehydrogenase (NAD+) catalytic subunit
MKYYISNVEFQHPILNASGCWAFEELQLDELYNSNLAGIVCKTATLFSKKENPIPNYYYDSSNNTTYNCKGIPNLGYNYYKLLSVKYLHKPFILSLAYDTFDKLKLILLDYDEFIYENTIKEFLVEINLSCPNTKDEIVGYSLCEMEELFKFLNNLRLKKIKFGLKLPPYFELKSIQNCSELFNKYNKIIKYIVTCNSIPNGLPIFKGKFMLSQHFGGISGKTNKSIALSNVYSFSKTLEEIKIIGCGGICTFEDVIDYITNGANFVQIASCFYNSTTNKLNTNDVNKLINDFDNYLKI